jgi:predicted amidophosphoribosyltransferase
LETTFQSNLKQRNKIENGVKSMSKKCQSCFKEIADDAQFCNACGSPQSTQQTQSNYGTPPPPPPPPNYGTQSSANAVFSSELRKTKLLPDLLI